MMVVSPENALAQDRISEGIIAIIGACLGFLVNMVCGPVKLREG
jgi:hypothetical protein